MIVHYWEPLALYNLYNSVSCAENELCFELYELRLDSYCFFWVMFQVCKTWKLGFEESVTKLTVQENSPNLPLDGSIVARYWKLASVKFRKLHSSQDGLKCLQGATKLASLSFDSRWGKFSFFSPRLVVLLDEDFRYLSGKPITSLDLFSCDMITGSGLACLQEAPLTSLNLELCGNLEDASLQHLRRFMLTKLDLTHCRKISSVGMENLKGVPLVSLNLQQCNIDDAGLACLEGMPLASLNLAGCSNLTDRGLVVLRGLPLTSLTLGALRHNISDGRMSQMSLFQLRGKALTSLDVGDLAGGVSSLGMACLQGMLLTRLRIEGCYILTDLGLKFLVGMPLRKLKLERCGRGIRGSGLEILAGMPLTSLGFGLHGCGNLTDATLALIRGKALTSLDLRGCGKVTDLGLSYLHGLPLKKVI